MNGSECSRVLVTGGAGFIGSHLVDKLLNEGFEAEVFDNLDTGKLENIAHNQHKKEFHFSKGDILDFDQIKKSVKDKDVVFHEAAIASVTLSVKNPVLVNEVNVTGTLNVLKACSDLGVKRFIYASSAAIYGNTPSPQKREDITTNPTSPYGISKLAAENYVKLFHKLYGLETVSLRYFNVYGPRQRHSQYSGVIPIFINRLLSNEPPIIYGNGEQKRDFVNVQDIVDANMLALRSKNAVGEVFNIGTGKATSIDQLAKMILKILGKTGPKSIYTDPRTGDTSKGSYADISRARRVLGFNPRVSLEEGITKLVEWYRHTREERYP